MISRMTKYGVFFIIALILGIFIGIQFLSLQDSSLEFSEKNPLRELRLQLETNEQLKGNLESTQNKLEDLQTRAQIVENAQAQIESAKYLSGEKIKDSSVQVLFEGKVEEKTFVALVQTFWKAGVENMKINGVHISANSAGFDSAGGQILLGGVALESPYLFELSGDAQNLQKILDVEKGELSAFQSSDVKITLSVNE